MHLRFAWRYFRARKSTQAINIIAWVSVAAIVVGTASLIIILSAFNGFEGLVRSLYASFYTDIRVEPVRGRILQADTVTIRKIRALRSEFWQNVNVTGTDADLNTALERANRVSDFIELGELMARDALTREESCGGHFREEHQNPDGECKRDDVNFAHVAAWEFQGEGKVPLRNTEPLNYESVKMSVRSYK